MTDLVTGPRLLIGFDLSTATQWDSTDSLGTVHFNYEWTQEQWRHIEMVAFRLLLAQMNGTTEWNQWSEAITPEALEFFEEDMPAGLFSEDDDVEDSEVLNATTTAIGVVDCILKQFEEEIGKRGGSLP
jgi:hypothetical protein